MTRIRRVSPVSQSYYCWRSKSRRTRQVRQFIREKLKLEGTRLVERKVPSKLSLAAALFARRTVA